MKKANNFKEQNNAKELSNKRIAKTEKPSSGTTMSGKQGKKGKKSPNVDENGTIIIDPPKTINNKDHFHRLNYLYQIGNYNTLENNSYIGRILAKKYVNNLDIIGKKTKSNMLPNAKRTICKKCKSILIPSKTCTLSMETDSPQNIKIKKETRKRVIKREKMKRKMKKEKDASRRSNYTNITMAIQNQNGFIQGKTVVTQQPNVDPGIQLLNAQGTSQIQNGHMINSLMYVNSQMQPVNVPQNYQNSNGFIGNSNVVKKETNSDSLVQTVNTSLEKQANKDPVEKSKNNPKNEVFVITCKCGTKKRFKVGSNRNYKNFYEKDGVLLDVSK